VRSNATTTDDLRWEPGCKEGRCHICDLERRVAPVVSSYPDGHERLVVALKNVITLKE
jgi:hypothetical protein